MNKIGIIIKREYLTRVKKKSFIIMTILGPILFIGFMVTSVYISQTDSKEFNVLLTDTEGMFGKVLFKDEYKDSKYVKFSHQDAPMSDEAFRESTYDLKIDLEPDMLTVQSINLYYKSYPSFKVQKYISSQLEKSFERAKLAQNNVTPELYKKLKTKINLSTVDIDKIGESNVPTEVGFGVGMVLSIVIFMFIMLFGQAIMRGVLEEKTSRIVEVIVSSVKPFYLMMGKIIGVALVGLTQFVMWIALSGIFMMVMGIFFPDVFMDPNALMDQQMTPEVKEMMEQQMMSNPDMINRFYEFYHQINFPFIIFMFLFYFLGGYLLYGSLYAAIGSAVEAETDSQQFMMPIMMPLILGYIIATTGISNPESTAMWWGSLIPFTSPVVMMVKVGSMGMGFEPIDWPLVLSSMALLIMAFIGSVWVASKIYKAGILFHGKNVTYKELWKWLRYG